MKPKLNSTNTKFKQNYFKPKNPKKYIGDVNNIIYRSSWEEHAMIFFDSNKYIVRWGSELFPIPYIKPTDNAPHEYYPDFYVEYLTKDEVIKKQIIEVKPSKQTKKPTVRGKKKKTQIIEAVTWAVNEAKWKYAKAFCEKHNMEFKIFTEKTLFR